MPKMIQSGSGIKSVGVSAANTTAGVIVARTAINTNSAHFCLSLVALRTGKRVQAGVLTRALPAGCEVVHTRDVEDARPTLTPSSSRKTTSLRWPGRQDPINRDVQARDLEAVLRLRGLNALLQATIPSFRLKMNVPGTGNGCAALFAISSKSGVRHARRNGRSGGRRCPQAP